MSLRDYNKDWELMAKYLSNEVNYFEKSRFEEQVKNNEELESDFYIAKKAWDEAGYALQYKKINSEDAFNNILGQIKPSMKKVNRFNSRSSFVGVISFVVVLLIVAFLFYYPFGTLQKMLVFSTHNINKELILGDGSRIYLNQNSSVYYPTKFDSDKRFVSFEGEGFFQIAPKNEQPFVINVDQIEIKVLGTAFNIKAHPNDKNIVVTVDNGVVEVSLNTQKVFLHKGERVVFNKVEGSLIKSINQNRNYNSWITKEIIFEDDPMGLVVETLESVYGVQIELADLGIFDNRLTASFNNADIQSVMLVVCRTFNLEFEQDSLVFRLKNQMPY
ncbi:MAG: FecR family protein [Marinilabiliaceae bacterium]|nr:FecR family protein [Marinilabiliaceae bacterium]